MGVSNGLLLGFRLVLNCFKGQLQETGFWMELGVLG